MLVQPTQHGKYAVVYDVREGFENPDVVRRVELPDDPLEIANLEIPHDPTDHLIVAFVPSTVDDNPHIDPTYRKHLSMLPIGSSKGWLYRSLFHGSGAIRVVSRKVSLHGFHG